MGELTIKNRKNQNLSVLIEKNNQDKGLAIIMHGLGGNKNVPLLETLSRTFRNLGYSTIRFDTTNSFGKSDGDFENATTTSYYEDLEDVIKWAKQQNLYKEQFILAGHSIGGLCTSVFAGRNPSIVKAVIPISTVVSGNLSCEHYPNELLSKWEKQGFCQFGETKTKWDFITDTRKYDILDYIESLTMPFLIISGDRDRDTPTEHHKLLYEKLQCPKEIRVIKNGDHDLRKPENLEEIKEHIKNWITHLNT